MDGNGNVTGDVTDAVASWQTTDPTILAEINAPKPAPGSVPITTTLQNQWAALGLPGRWWLILVPLLLVLAL